MSLWNKVWYFLIGFGLVFYGAVKLPNVVPNGCIKAGAYGEPICGTAAQVFLFIMIAIGLSILYLGFKYIVFKKK